MENWKKTISIIFGIYSAILLILYVSFLLINREYVDVSTVGFVERLLSITTLSFLGFLLSYRRPENLISWLFVIIALMRQTGFLTTTVEILLAHGIEPTFGLLFWENFWFWWSGLTYSLLTFTIILFPNGRLPSPRWRLATGLLVL